MENARNSFKNFTDIGNYFLSLASKIKETEKERYDGMKKLLSLVLSACLAATMILPAAASDAALETRLANVTLATKKLLNIGDEYTEFSGYLNEGSPENIWSLSWQSKDANLNVTVTEGGKLVSYYLGYQEKTYITPSGELKKFPKLTKAQAQKLAQEFLVKVLDTPLESCELQEGTNLLAIYDNGNYNFYGALKLNGKVSPIQVNLCVNSAKKAVTSFYRSDGGANYASYPANAKISKDAANASLYAAVNMQLNYVVSEKDPKHAILQYTPQMKGDYVVDALTGTLVERKPQIFYREAQAAAKDISKTNGAGLTDVELKAVNELKGCLSSQELEAAARGVSELGINSRYHLDSSNYYVEKNNQEPMIYANLSFVERKSDQYSIKNVVLNAKTGAFLSMSAYASIDPNGQARYNRAESEKIARAFATKYNAQEYALTALASPTLEEKNAPYQSFSFVRQVNGIPFPGNEIVVTVNAMDGTIGNYSVSWNPDMTFAEAKGIKAEQEAKAVYQKAAGIALFYEYISTKADKTDSELKLVYGFAQSNVWGVDPITGKPLVYAQESAISFGYNDITGHFAQKQIETLAEYGVGYVGGAFHPNQNLTQKDALSLVIPACGFTLNPDSEEYEEALYSNAYSMGLLTSAEKNPSAAMTRASLTKLLVDAAGYGEVAQLKDIYRIGYKDEKAIPADLFGYVAIAKGLGIVQGNTNGNFNPNGVATRAQLAIMLYNILSR